MALRTKLSFAARALAAMLLISAMLVAWTQSQGSAQAASNRPTPGGRAVYVRVIDGETVEDLRSETVYRLANIDAARLNATCPAEARIGDRAAAMAGALVARARSLDLRATGDADRFGRPTAYVAADGSDIGEALVSQGFGRPMRKDGQPWCDADGGLNL
jgi:endonuclease YncB( thermonuclease family)